MPKLLTVNNAKIQKGTALGFLTAGLHLAPADASGFNTCPMASAGCKAACLNTSGHGRFDFVQNARIAKTQFFFRERSAFMAQLIKEIAAFIRKAKKSGITPAIRLNLTSDIQWETIKHEGKTVFEHFPTVQFYDYSKIARRFFQPLPTNYHLTFSRSESNHAVAETVAAAGHNVAVVFSSPDYPRNFMGREVVSGDETDLRFLDKRGVVIALFAKGQAKRDKSGFVVQVQGLE